MNNEEENLKDINDILSSLGSNKENIDGYTAHLRDTFLTAEKEYVGSLLENEEIRDFITEINGYSSEILFKNAQELVDKVEYGLIKDEEMEQVEQKLIILLAAIKDKVLEKKLSLYPDYNCGKRR